MAHLYDLDGAVGLAKLSSETGIAPIGLTEAFTDVGRRLGLDWAQSTAALMMSHAQQAPPLFADRLTPSQLNAMPPGLESVVRRTMAKNPSARPQTTDDLREELDRALRINQAYEGGTQETNVTNQCHDITVFPSKNIAAGACSGNGIILDISDPFKPVRIDDVTDKGFAYWHSATFNNDGTQVVFTDEWGGGGRPRCQAGDPVTWGANAIYTINDGQLDFGGYFKIPSAQSEEENCVAHNGSIIPVPGRDVFVQAWYQGGMSILDFTDPANAYEIARMLDRRATRHAEGASALVGDDHRERPERSSGQRASRRRAGDFV